MLVGDAEEWRKRFRTVDERLLERISACWPSCVARLSGQQHEEDTITMTLLATLWSDGVVRQIVHWLEYQFEPFGHTADGVAFSKGKIDLAVFLDQNRETYLAYECKRLNVRNGRVTRSLAGPYVTQGMIRFLTEQYAEGLPVGCMLGYVIDGDTRSATRSVTNSIRRNRLALSLRSGPKRAPQVAGIRRLSTVHLRAGNGSAIEILHAFLPF